MTKTANFAATITLRQSPVLLGWHSRQNILCIACGYNGEHLPF